jgi:hypothetical protein
VIILEPLLVVPAASNKDTATFIAVPTHLADLNPDLTGHGSGYKSSKIEFKANSHSLTGTKNLLRAEFSPFPNGSAVNVRPN